MSQLSLLFKDRILSIYQLNQQNDFVIGHAPECNIHIDSLAVSPKHAKITFDTNDYLIEQLDSESRVLINNKAINFSSHLSDGDHITISKHTLIFTFDEHDENHPPPPEPFSKPKAAANVSGWVQYLNGGKMGQTMHIQHNMITITDDKEDNVAMISNRTDGFYISFLKGSKPTEVNKTSIGDKSVKLEDNSNISLGSQEVLFYLE